MPSGRPVLKEALRSALREIAVGQGKDGWRAGCKSRACGPGLAGIGPQRGADVLHEGQGRLWRGPQSEHPGLLIRWVAEAVPVPAGRYEHRARYRLLRLAVTDDQQPSAEHVDGLVELIMRVRDRPGARPGTVISIAANPGGRPSWPARMCIGWPAYKKAGPSSW